MSRRFLRSYGFIVTIRYNVNWMKARPLMPVTYVTGDPFLTKQQTLAFGYNVRARTENTPLAMAFQQRYPAVFATYRKRANSGRLRAGDLWVWRDSSPRLAVMVVRESAVGATRPRYVDSAVLRLTQDYQREGITSLAIAPLGRESEVSSIRAALDLLLPGCPLDVLVYEHYQPDVPAES